MADRSPLAVVTEKLLYRYNHPSRKAYVYVFQLAEDADLPQIIVPTADRILAAWVDEGYGELRATDAASAAALANAAALIKPQAGAPHPLTAHERRQMMARIITFCLKEAEEDGESVVRLHLYSRALGFTPKGTREAFETWRKTSDGIWYSSYQPQGETE